MTYDSVWECLNEAVRRVMDATGCPKEEAQADICQALADGLIGFWGRLKEHANRHMTSKDVLEGAAFAIRTPIRPKDLDWEQSRPRKPWTVRQGSHRLPGPWTLEWIKLSRTDITSVLCAPRARRGDAKHPSSGAKQRTPKGRPSFDRAKRAIDELYPDGPPDQAALPNKQFCGRVRDKLKDLKLLDVHDDTILRAAGRRK
ncbi:MAG: hypothetical protein QOI12_5241 [Alphaproteobacteria bacterium]|jgi:hypothetical protein|nr:hypothetical protein [Alphaproteobacteria bacterium]